MPRTQGAPDGRAHAAQANQVRIVGGLYRRRLLPFPDAPGLRPTPDRVRETLFNWLGQDLTGMACLDVFAGSGALGFEAASRGAARVVMLEKSRPAFDALKRNQTMLGAQTLEIHQTESLSWMKACRDTFDLVFLDPPFSSDLLQQALPLATALLAPEGMLYVESAHMPSLPDGFIIHRQGRAGQSGYALLTRDNTSPSDQC